MAAAVAGGEGFFIRRSVGEQRTAWRDELYDHHRPPTVNHIAHIHSRMPIILDQGSYSDWLNIGIKGLDAKALLLDHPAHVL